MSMVDDRSLDHLQVSEHGLVTTSIDRNPAGIYIEFLQAQLLAERSVSKAAQQYAQQLANKVLELEHKLQSEVQIQRKAEDARVNVLATQSQDFPMEPFELDKLDIKEDIFGKKLEGLVEINSPHVSMEETFLQRQNVGVQCYLISPSDRDVNASSVGRAEKCQSRVNQDVNSTGHMIEHDIRDSEDTSDKSIGDGLDRWSKVSNEIVPSGEQLKVSTVLHDDTLHLDQEQLADQVPLFLSKGSSVTQEREGEHYQEKNLYACSSQGLSLNRWLNEKNITEHVIARDDLDKPMGFKTGFAENFENTKIRKQKSSIHYLATSDKINQVELGQDSKDAPKEHLEDTISIHLQDANNVTVIPEGGRQVDETSGSVLGSSMQETDDYSNEMAVSSKSNGKTLEKGSLWSDESKPGADEMGGSSSGNSGREWHRVHHKRLSSSFKFKMEIDFSEEGINFVEESNKSTVLDKSQSSEIDGTSSCLPDSSFQDSDTHGRLVTQSQTPNTFQYADLQGRLATQAHIPSTSQDSDLHRRLATHSHISGTLQGSELKGRLATESHTPSTFFPGKAPAILQNAGVNLCRRRRSQSDQNQVVPVACTGIDAQRCHTSQFDQTKVDVASTMDRRGDSHQISSNLGPCIVQKQDNLGSIAQGELLLQEAEQSIVKDMNEQGERRKEAFLPEPGCLSSTSRNAFRDGKNTVLQSGRNDKERRERAYFTRQGEISGEINAQNQNASIEDFRNLPTNKTIGMDMQKPSLQASQCTVFDNRLVESGYFKDSPWVETFRRRIKQYIDPPQLRPLGGFSVPYYGAVQEGHYSGRNRTSSATWGISRPPISEPEFYCENQMNNHVFPGPYVANASRALNGSLDRARDIIQALEMLKKQMQSSNDSFVLQSNGGYRVRQLSGQSLPQLSPYTVPSGAEFSASQQALPRMRVDDRNMQRYVRREPAGRRNLQPRLDGYHGM